MKIRIYCLGNKMPAWVEQACSDYVQRLSGHYDIAFCEIPLLRRSKHQLSQVLQKESNALLAALGSQDYLVALDVEGKSHSTAQLAQRMAHWQQLGRPLSFVIGGPEGLSDAVLARAEERWSLSALTLPHPLVRVVLAEQLYRGWSILNHHPYHRE